jgi:transcriptional regulator with XRE-family HTH domain
VASFVKSFFSYRSNVDSVKSCEVVSAEVARLLREERAKRKLSLNELSAKAGLSRQMVSYIEQEKRNPSLDTLLRLSWALKINLDDVIRRARLAAMKMKPQ